MKTPTKPAEKRRRDRRVRLTEAEVRELAKREGVVPERIRERVRRLKFDLAVRLGFPFPLPASEYPSREAARLAAIEFDLALLNRLLATNALAGRTTDDLVPVVPKRVVGIRKCLDENGVEQTREVVAGTQWITIRPRGGGKGRPPKYSEAVLSRLDSISGDAFDRAILRLTGGDDRKLRAVREALRRYRKRAARN